MLNSHEFGYSESRESAVPLRFPGGIVVCQQVFRPIAEPVVAVAALGFDLCEIVLDYAVAAGEDRPVYANFVIAGPNGRGIRIGNGDPVAVLFFQPKAHDLRLLVPAAGGSNRLGNFRAWLLEADEKANDVRAFPAGNRGGLVRPAAAGY